jgi:phosphate transport system substrate-binding protein
LIDIRRPAVLAILLATTLLAACGRAGDTDWEGDLAIDGSSTVLPISQAVAEEFIRAEGSARIAIGQSGTGGGFEKFCRGDIDISNASRSIKEDEISRCRENGIDAVELAVANDGPAVVVNLDNDWVDCLTVQQLRSIWRPDDPVERWNEIDPTWPDKEIRLYGPGTDSGTFDYFTEAVIGEEGASRSDYNATEDDNVIIQGVEGDDYGLGYFGYAYYSENTERLKALGIDNGDGCILPTAETIRTGTYAPLSRPLFIYVDGNALRALSTETSATPMAGEQPRPPLLLAFLQYYLTEGAEVIPFVGYVPLEPDQYQEQLDMITATASLP